MLPNVRAIQSVMEVGIIDPLLNLLNYIEGTITGCA
jgi:hypothetical protein